MSHGVVSPATVARWAASMRVRGDTTRTDAELARGVAEWLALRGALGWLYWESVYAGHHFGAPWPLSESAPESTARAMRAWWEASRHRGGGTAPEDVAECILAVTERLLRQGEVQP